MIYICSFPSIEEKNEPYMSKANRNKSLPNVAVHKLTTRFNSVTWMAISLSQGKKWKVIGNNINIAFFKSIIKLGREQIQSFPLLRHPYLGIIRHVELGCNLQGNCGRFQWLIRSSGNKMKQGPSRQLGGGQLWPITVWITHCD